MTTTGIAPTTARTARRPEDRIVLGVDGFERNQAAIAWAHQEAVAHHQGVALVAASPPVTIPMAGMGEDFSPAVFEADAREHLQAVRDRLGDDVDATIYVETGVPSRVIVDRAADASLVVIGKRGLGTFRRLLVGSTSIAVAGRSPVPVVVVPDTWKATNPAAPIVVGVEVHQSDATAVCPDAAVLDFAFERAARLGVPLIAVSAWEIPALYAWSPIDVNDWMQARHAALTKALAPWTERYPDVPLTASTPAQSAAAAVLDEADAQLIVLGRHTSTRHVGGFTVGSTARGVLHYAECPVAVVPSLRDQATATEDNGDSVSPMF